MDANEFIELAGKLVGQGKPGARSAVSRAYYGAFHMAMALLDEFATSPGATPQAHVLVSNFLLTTGNADAKHAGRLLSDLHGERIKADYRIDNASVETITFAQVAVETAHEIRNKLNSYSGTCDSDEATVLDLRAAIEKVTLARRR